MSAIPRSFTLLGGGQNTLTGLNSQTITGNANGAWTVAANGTNQNITLTPSGTGDVIIAGAGTTGENLLVGTTTDSANGRIQLGTHTTVAGGVGFGTGAAIWTPSTNTIALSRADGSFDLRYSGAGTTISFGSQNANISLALTSGNGTVAVTFDNTQLATFTGAIIESSDTLSGAGAVSITKTLTKFTSTGVGNALTLADGINGQVKRIIHDVDGGTGVLTPTTKTGYTTVTFTNAGDSVTLQYVTTRGWIVIGSFGVTIA